MSESDTKYTLDTLYHNLRTLSLLPYSKERHAAIAGLTLHLVSKHGHYPGLLNWLQYYGKQYLLPEAIKIVETEARANCWDVKRAVELGSGSYAWFGNGIAEAFGVDCVRIDKRPEFSPNHVVDLELDSGLINLSTILKPSDLLVCSEFLHTINNAPLLIKRILDHNWAILEFDTDNLLYGKSYTKQIRKFGCKPLIPKQLGSLFGNTNSHSYSIPPYMLIVHTRKDTE